MIVEQWMVVLEEQLALFASNSSSLIYFFKKQAAIAYATAAWSFMTCYIIFLYRSISLASILSTAHACSKD